MVGRSLLETPIELWTYETVDAFLDARIPEDEQIEYKKDFTETIQDSFVSMANGRGGYIFVGVDEVRGRKTPLRWGLLDPAKDNALTLYNKAGSETSPPVRPHVRVFDKPDGTGQIAVAKIASGDYPPYFVKNRGVKVRVGDTDIDADPRELESLFSRREAFSGLRDRHRAQFESLVNPSPALITEPRTNLCLHAFLAPLIERTPLRFGQNTGRTIREFGKQYAAHLSLNWDESRDDDGITFDSERTTRLAIQRDGRVTYRRTFPLPADRTSALLGEAAPIPPVPTLDVFRLIYSVIRVADYIYREHAQYMGAVYLGVALVDLVGREFFFPDLFLQYGVERPIVPKRFERWVEESIPYYVGDDPIDVAQQFLKSLLWRSGFQDYEGAVHALGSAVRRR